MIEFKNLSKETPYIILKEKYDEAFSLGQENIEAIAISSYNMLKKEVDSRFVNLKFIENNRFIFFSNYQSSKSLDFSIHKQISALFFWQSSNTQIRMKARIEKTSPSFNKSYFKSRRYKKNALSISSNQSREAASYDEVINNYEDTLKNKNLDICPNYWGGYFFIPYYFEFWEGHESRINKREIFYIVDGLWKQSFLQP